MDKQTHRRCLYLCLILVTGLSALSVRLYFLQVVDRDKYAQQAGSSYEKSYPLLAKRGTIVDCNGEVIAKSIISKTLIVDKYHMKEVRTVVRGVACQELSKTPEWYDWDEKTRNLKVKHRSRTLLNKNTDRQWIIDQHLEYACEEIATPLGMTKDELKKLINIGEKSMADKVIVKDIAPDIASRLHDLIIKKHIKGFRFTESMKRSHNSPELLTHITGFSFHAKGDEKEVGKAGIEKACEEYLAGKDGFKIEMRDLSGEVMPAHKGSVHAPINGNNVLLTIDMGIQAIVEEQLNAAVLEYDPVRATIIVMDPNNGDVLAMASRPHYNVATREGILTNEFNYGLQGEYEPGSTFKLVAIAAALNENIRKLNDSVFCHNGFYSHYSPKFSVRDEHAKSYLKVWEIAQKSNNIGTFMLAKQVGQRKYMDYVKNFGFGKKTDIGIGSESKGLFRDNGNVVDFSRNTFGYAIRVTPLQIANFYSAIANGGNLMKPRMIKKVEDYRGVTVKEYKPEIIRRVISENAAKDCRQALKTVVELGGTATRADVEGFSEGGKTGTAEIWDNKLKAYSKTRKTVSFVGMLPIESPQFVCVVVVEEPRTKKEYNFGGGTVAAPIWKETMKRVAAYRNLTPTEEVEPTLGNAL